MCLELGRAHSVRRQGKSPKPGSELSSNAWPPTVPFSTDSLLTTLTHILFPLPVLKLSALPGMSVCPYLNGSPVEEALACTSSNGSPGTLSCLESKRRQGLPQACSEPVENTQYPPRDRHSEICSIHPHKGSTSKMLQIHRTLCKHRCTESRTQPVHKGYKPSSKAGLFPRQPRPSLESRSSLLRPPQPAPSNSQQLLQLPGNRRTCQPLRGQAHQRWADTDPNQWRPGRTGPLGGMPPWPQASSCGICTS